MTSKGRGGRRYRPYMFTEQGISERDGLRRESLTCILRRFRKQGIRKAVLMIDEEISRSFFILFWHIFCGQRL